MARVDRHAEAFDRCGGEHAHVLQPIAGVVDVHVVVVRVAGELEQRADAVDGAACRGRQTPHVEHVVAAAARDLGVPGDRPHVDRVGAAPRVERRVRRVRGDDREGVVAGAEVDVQVLERRVGDAGRAHVEPA